MSQVLAGFTVIWAVIAVGWLVAQLRILDASAQQILTRVAYYVGLPALLFHSVHAAEVTRIFSANVIVSIGAVASTWLVYTVAARFLWHRSLAHTIIGGYASCYVNANNMGLPIAAYVLHDTSWVAPILLMQVAFLQPVGLAVLDALREKREGHTGSWWWNLSLPLRNPMTIAVVLGLISNLTAFPVPGLLLEITELLGGIGVPAMLLSFGISLRLGPLPGKDNLAETGFIIILKVLAQPLFALGLAALVGLDAATTIAVVVMAGLPTAQNVFVFAMRADESVPLARDVIFITSVLSIASVTTLVSVLSL